MLRRGDITRTREKEIQRWVQKLNVPGLRSVRRHVNPIADWKQEKDFVEKLC